MVEAFKVNTKTILKANIKVIFFCRNIVIIMFILYQLGIMTTYVQFVAENIKYIVDDYIKILTVEMYMILLLIPFLAINMIRHLKYLTPFSTLANVITLVTFAVVIYFCSRGLPPFSKRLVLVDLTKYPLFFGTSIFALHSLGVVSTLKSKKLC